LRRVATRFAGRPAFDVAGERFLSWDLGKDRTHALVVEGIEGGTRIVVATALAHFEGEPYLSGWFMPGRGDEETVGPGLGPVRLAPQREAPVAANASPGR
jgi:hypothetical protein